LQLPLPRLHDLLSLRAGKIAFPGQVRHGDDGKQGVETCGTLTCSGCMSLRLQGASRQGHARYMSRLSLIGFDSKLILRDRRGRKYADTKVVMFQVVVEVRAPI
jgi:hypothetical protein